MLRELVTEIEKQGGGGLLLEAVPLDPAVSESIIAGFRSDRDAEYREFCGRCDDFLAEIEKETRAGNFTFAEIEENEEDLHKLEGWLGKIQARDAFGGHLAEQAVAAIARCRNVLRDFTQEAYSREGLGPTATSVTSLEGVADVVGANSFTGSSDTAGAPASPPDQGDANLDDQERGR